MPMTADNTKFLKWFERAHEEFISLGLAAPGRREAKNAYELGESPQSWAAYEAPHWNDQPWRHGRPDEAEA